MEYDLGDDMVKVLVGNELKNQVSQNLTGIIALGKAESESENIRDIFVFLFSVHSMTSLSRNG